MAKNPTILCIEDDPNNRLLIQRILTAEGFIVLEASDATRALEILNTSQPDLILMDINMPDIDGYSLTGRIRKMPQFNQVPIVAVTANVMRGDRERTLEAGCDGYIQKPIDVDALPGQIWQFLKEVRRG